MKNKLVSLNELATKLKVNKSTLHFYQRSGLIKPIETCGRMHIFDGAPTLKRLKEIIKYKKEGLKLEQIKKKLK